MLSRVEHGKSFITSGSGLIFTDGIEITLMFKQTSFKWLKDMTLAHCMLGIFSCFCCLLIVSKNYFRNTIRLSDSWIQIRTDVLFDRVKIL